MRAPLTGPANRAQAMPADADDRLGRIDAALGSLENERRRLERLGLETPLARCHEERRYWEFLRAIHRVAAGEPESGAWR